MQRRNFLKVMGAGGALVAISPALIQETLYAEDGSVFQAFEKVQLVDGSGMPLKTSDLTEEENYVFNYPHVSTPAILINLSEPTNKDIKLKTVDGDEYIWKGGIGSKGTIVAYSAICAHQMAHPTPDESFIQYCKKGKKTAAFTPKEGESEGGIMVCSSHMASYDVNSGCKVLGGPADQPLASIILEIDKDDTIWASAVLGGERFHDYFKAFKHELKKYYGGKRKGKKRVFDAATTLLLSNYTKDIILY